MKTFLLSLFALFLLGCSTPKQNVVYTVNLQEGTEIIKEREFTSQEEAVKYVEYFKDNHDYIIIPVRY